MVDPICNILLYLPCLFSVCYTEILLSLLFLLFLLGPLIGFKLPGYDAEEWLEYKDDLYQVLSIQQNLS